MTLSAEARLEAAWRLRQELRAAISVARFFAMDGTAVWRGEPDRVTIAAARRLWRRGATWL